MIFYQTNKEIKDLESLDINKAPQKTSENDKIDFYFELCQIFSSIFGSIRAMNFFSRSTSFLLANLLMVFELFENDLAYKSEIIQNLTF